LELALLTFPNCASHAIHNSQTVVPLMFSTLPRTSGGLRAGMKKYHFRFPEIGSNAVLMSTDQDELD
jgi:hypothetical protein